MHKAFIVAASLPWALDQHTLTTILEIANREGEGPEAVAAKLGRPLSNEHRGVVVRDGVAVVSVVGPIFRRASMFTEISGATSIDLLARDFAAAVEDPAVSAVVLDIDSPGGEVNGVHEFAAQVFAVRGKKPIVAYVGGMGASAAYWIASAADRIVVDRTASVGSIGVLMALPAPDADSAKEIEIVSSQSPLKRVDVTKKDGRALIQARVDQLADIFVATVARNRGVDTDTVLDGYGKGSVMLADDALRAGMVDEIGSLESTIAALSVRTSTQQEKRMHSIATALGLAADATEDQIVAAARAAVTDRADLLAATGESSVLKAVGVIDSARESAAKADEIAKQLADANAQLAKIEHEQIVASLRGDGKLTAHMEKMAARMSLEQLREFAAEAEPVKTLTVGKVDTEEQNEPSVINKPWEQLSTAEKVEMHESNPILYQAVLADYRARGARI